CRQPPHAAYPQLRRPGPGLAAYLALLRLGVAVPRLLPGARWALTPPFHPYPWIKGGLFSVALSVASRRPGVTWQSALGSSDFPRHAFPAGMPRPSHPTATRRKATGPRRVGASLPGQPAQQASQAVRRQAPRRTGSYWLLGRDPEAVALGEDQLLDAGCITCPQRRRGECHRMGQVQSVGVVERQELAGTDLRRDHQGPLVGSQAGERAVRGREPVRPERRIEGAGLGKGLPARAPRRVRRGVAGVPEV